MTYLVFGGVIYWLVLMNADVRHELGELRRKLEEIEYELNT